MHKIKKTYFSIIFVFFMGVFFVQSIEAQQRFSVSGKWRCQSSPILVSKIKNLPKGSLIQRTAYLSNSKGEWTSNSVFEYKISGTSEKFFVQSTASGTHFLRGNIITENIQNFRILDYKNKTNKMKKPSIILKKLIMKSIRKKTRRNYFLVLSSENYYAIQPLENKGQKTIRITCKRR